MKKRVEIAPMIARRGLLVLTCMACVAGATPAAAIDCPPAVERDTAFLAGEAAGRNGFARAFGAGWTLSLVAVAMGWDIRVFDSGGADLSFDTPPRMAPDPRQVHGWHLCNADDTGANTGDVNAPERLRLFTSHAIAGGDAPTTEPEWRGAANRQG